MKRVLCVRLNNWPIERLRRTPLPPGGRRRESSLSRVAPGEGSSRLERPTFGTSNGPDGSARNHGLTPALSRRTGTSPAQFKAPLAVDRRRVGPPSSSSPPATRARGAPRPPGPDAGRGRGGVSPASTHADHEPDRDARGLAAVGQVADAVHAGRRRSPRRHRRGDPAAVFLDVTGCDRLFGGFDAILSAGDRRPWRRLGLSADLAVAPTPGAAWALAHNPNRVVTEAELDGRPRPPCRRPPCGSTPCHGRQPCGPSAMDTVARLDGRSPGTGWSRPGSAATCSTRLDQATGRVAEPLVFLDPPSPVVARHGVRRGRCTSVGGVVGRAPGSWSTG